MKENKEVKKLQISDCEIRFIRKSDKAPAREGAFHLDKI